VLEDCTCESFLLVLTLTIHSQITQSFEATEMSASTGQFGGLISEELAIDFGLRVKLTDQDIQLFEAAFGDASVVRKCVMCRDSESIESRGGDFVKETMCSIAEGKKFSRPRIVCHDCSELHAWKEGTERKLSESVFPLMKVHASLKVMEESRALRSPPTRFKKIKEESPHGLRNLGRNSLLSASLSLGNMNGVALSGGGQDSKDVDIAKLSLSDWNRNSRDNQDRRSYRDAISSTSKFGQDHESIPFLETLQVVSNSSTYNAGLRQGDLFIKFGPFTHRNFTGLEGLKTFTLHNGKSPIECLIGRRLTGGDGGSAPRMRVKRKIVLAPKHWSQGVALGCVLNSYPAPVPRDQH
jgi:hypothetical protein